MALIGLGSIGLSYLLGHFVWTLPIIALVGAIRLAKPDSEWARRFYDERQLAESRTRFNHAPEAAGLRE
jgi:hypothetical protein